MYVQLGSVCGKGKRTICVSAGISHGQLTLLSVTKLEVLIFEPAKKYNYDQGKINSTLPS